MEHSMEEYPFANNENKTNDEVSSKNIGADADADKEKVDSLTMEYSSLSPAEHQVMTKLAADIKKNLIGDFGKYISDESKINLNNIGNKFVVVSEEDFRTFREDWALEDSLDILESAKIMGSYFPVGDIVVMKDMDAKAKDIWKNYLEGFFDKDHQIDERTAITIIRYSLIISTLTHEIVHSVQIPEGFKEFEEKSKEKKITDKDIKDVIRFKALAECGASYITNKILKERYTDIMPIEIDPATEEVRYDPAEKRIKFFDHILDKYGENVYYVFFNTKPNNMDSESFNNLKEDVFREFNSQVLADIEIIKEDEKEAFDQLAD